MLIVLQAIVFITYISFIIYKKGVLSSFSQSAYEVDSIYFTLFCFGIGVPNAFYLEPFGAIAAFLLCLVGATVMYKESKYDMFLHQLGAAGAVLSLCIGAYVIAGQWWLLPAIIILSIPFYKLKNHIWWIEIISFSVIMIFYLFFM